jgi:hypothetical protein
VGGESLYFEEEPFRMIGFRIISNVGYTGLMVCWKVSTASLVTFLMREVSSKISVNTGIIIGSEMKEESKSLL